MATGSIPMIDPRVKHVGVSKLRELNATRLKDNPETLVIQDNDNPLAVLLSYENFLIMQQQLMAVYNTLELLTDEKEKAALVASLADLKFDRVRAFDDIEAELEAKK